MGLPIKILMLLPMVAFGQIFSFTQDAKLAVLSDDYGNTPYTPDLTLKVAVTDFKNDLGEVYVGFKGEWANLRSGSLFRYGGEFGHSIELGFGRIVPLVGYGILVRDGFTWQSWEFSAEGVVDIGKGLSILALNTYTKSEWDVWRYSFHLGLQYRIKRKDMADCKTIIDFNCDVLCPTKTIARGTEFVGGALQKFTGTNLTKIGNLFFKDTQLNEIDIRNVKSLGSTVGDNAVFEGFTKRWYDNR